MKTGESEASRVKNRIKICYKRREKRIASPVRVPSYLTCENNKNKKKKMTTNSTAVMSDVITIASGT
jgi:hypothetical protein